MTDVTADRRGRGKRDLIGLAISVAVCGAVAGLGAAATRRSVGSWYQTLNKPSFNPPDWVFGPVWTILYLMNAVAAWRIWRSDSPAVRQALTLYTIQLGLNLAWSVTFFGRRRIAGGLADIVVLILAIAATIWMFRRIDRTAARMMVPYLVWVAFALVLNAELLRLNPDDGPA